MKLHKALATISGLTFVSRILGLVREILIANLFGAGIFTDAFNVAFRLPNLLRRLFAEGAFSQAFVPILSEYKAQRGDAATRLLVNHVASLLGLIVLLISILGVIGAPWLIHATAGGFANQPEKFALTVELTRITFPYIFFMAMVALSAGVLNTWSRFAIPAFTPVLLNLSFIAMALLAAPHFEQPVMALAWGAFIGGALQLALQIPALARIGMLPRFSLSTADPGVMRILKLMGPATLGVSVAQISLLINTAFASWLPTGSVSWLNYADRLMEFPMGILGAALGTILLPSLSKMKAQNDAQGFSATLDWGLRVALLLTAPCAIGMMVLAVPLAATLFQHGAFKAADTLATQSALLTYSIGLCGLILVKILAPAFYSRQDIRTPLKYALISLTATQLMNILFLRVLDLEDFGLLPHAGLALSISLAATLNAALLYRGLRRCQAFVPHAGWSTFGLKLLCALGVMGCVLYFAMGSQTDWLKQGTLWRILHLAWVMGIGGAAYFAVLFALGFRPADFKRRV
ncbi:murein biosynthesis integral membrane protein MurJ [Uliginosibacterium sp. 31-16]|uniref:murein biosynthesis integral membrane protein MurJ n=1 Tax=Uliginosibacterium sp. 31-16 TaxID=3068315 RepID=UPI00273FEC23|nr:murein biosynthesis integral membrane protein MurJ [Uliginosibacterium sp. 31-16]MDP5240471.1 murein biosynthesis integral membrane protein MurJ [Uliginosibacterium sp. 31-16]